MSGGQGLAGPHPPGPAGPSARTDPGGARQRIPTAVVWWTATILTLVVLDDLTFGPLFWIISRLGSPLLGFTVALAIYVPVQVLLVRAGTSETPSRPAAYVLNRLHLQRRSRNVAAREQRMRARVTGVLSAGALSLAIGGVLPPLVLWRAGYSTTFVRRLSWLTALVYSLEFALIHGAVPGLI